MPHEMYRAHRERFLDALAARGAIAVIPTATPKAKNHDTHYRFRPDSDFWYLTGFGEPDCVLVLAPGDGRGMPRRSVLFLRPRLREEEVWTGARLGVEAAPEALGVDLAYPIAELWPKLRELLRGHERVVYRTGADEARDRALLGLLAKLRAEVRSPAPLPQEIVDPAPILHELRVVKSGDELERMRRAAEITAAAHSAALQVARPGARESGVEARIEYEFRSRGADGPAYATIVAGGANACVLHYVANRDELRAGELVLIDAGAELECYASDVTRTFPVDGRFRPEQRELYELVLRAQLAALERVKPGETVQSVHDAAVRALAGGLVDLGLVGGSVDEAIETGAYRRFYMHRTSHWLGLDVHDCGAYFAERRSRALASGMVLTVEPGLYVAPDDDTVDARWRGIGIRIEDDVLVTDGGCEILTASIPKTVAEVEAACAQRPALRSGGVVPPLGLEPRTH